MNRLMLETLITGHILYSDDYESARDSVIRMFNFRETMDLCRKGLDPSIIFIEIITSMELEAEKLKGFIINE